MIIDDSMGTKKVLAVPTYLRQWRKFRKLTQEQLAERVGLTAPSVSQLETGKQGFTDQSLAQYASALKCTPAELLSFDPRRADSFWPLLQAAEKLEGGSRRQAHRVIAAAVLRDAGESE